MNENKYRPFPQYLPTEGQAVWVCRFQKEGDPIAATFSLIMWTFITDLTSIQLDAWSVVMWRPRKNT
jgi:hypothetical protein